MTDLHLVSWNRPKMTELVIKTIHRNTKRDSFRLVVLDNGSDGDTPELLQQLADSGFIDEYIPIKTNLGLEASRNLLLKNCTTSDRFVCVDNDCLIQPMIGEVDWLDQLNDLMDRYEDYAAISARTQVMIGTGNIFETADDAGDDIVDFPHPGGSFRIMDTKLVHFVGGWQRPMAGNPDDFHALGRGAEERLVCGKLREAGFKTAFAVDVKTLHLFGPKDTTDKWGYDKNMKPEDSGHSDIHHPVLEQGDQIEDIIEYSGKELATWYL